jgi:hypothetical protein
MPKITIKRVGSYATSEDTLKVPTTVLSQEAKEAERADGTPKEQVSISEKDTLNRYALPGN